MQIKIEWGHTIDEWEHYFSQQIEEGTLWDYPYEELFNGALDPFDNMTYWFIDGRLYETDSEILKLIKHKLL